MDRKQELNEIVEKWNLLNHPFYQAWSAGTLPVEALQVYAREYGAFIETLPQGWRTLNDAETAHEEKEHAEMWHAFSKSLNAPSGSPDIEQSISLAQTARSLFALPATALGALYAFEVQQPATAKSKLDGLKKWYNIEQSGEKYFEAHSVNWHESEKILAQINALPFEEQEHALEACAKMSE
ncbi:MAG TPA: iron-containing redox enzyme family protein, partial [Anaerolineales bacterium]|nr:iron-containing redox enzyme family protein [Anaerolineales bacterium]